MQKLKSNGIPDRHLKAWPLRWCPFFTPGGLTVTRFRLAVAPFFNHGLEIVQAWNGLEALERFQASAPFEIDAILMDMQMPQMDGCEAARRIRALDRPDAAAVPIIAVTANAFSEDVSATTAAGMDAHVSKPIDFAVLRQTLERLLSPRTE